MPDANGEAPDRTGGWPQARQEGAMRAKQLTELHRQLGTPAFAGYPRHRSDLVSA